MNRRTLARMAATTLMTLGGLGAAAIAMAQAYPQRPIRIIVPFAPGGDSDAFARLVGEKMTERTGQSVVVENRPGAGGVLGFQAVKDAAPDGYTMGLIAGTTALPALIKGFPLEWYRQITPVGMLQKGPLILAVNDKVPARNLPDLLAYAKAHPGQLNIGSPGGMANLYSEALKTRAGVDIVVVPYKGNAPAQMANLANEVQITFESVNSAKGHFATGKLRPIAVGTRQPTALMPGVAPIAEAVPGLEMTYWMGFVAPAGTPAEAVAKLNSLLGEIVQMPDVVKRINDGGAEPYSLTPTAMAKLLEEETQLMVTLARAARIEPQ